MEKKIIFSSVKEMINWMIDNDGVSLYDNYGRCWKYEDKAFYFANINEPTKEGLFCLHLYSAGHYFFTHLKTKPKMNPNKKAEELIEKFGNLAVDVVEEILKASPSLPILSDNGTYGSDIEESTKWWQQVKELIISHE